MLRCTRGGNGPGRGVRWCWQCRTGRADSAERTRSWGRLWRAARSVAWQRGVTGVDWRSDPPQDPKGRKYWLFARHLGVQERSGSSPTVTVLYPSPAVKKRRLRRDRRTLARSAATCPLQLSDSQCEGHAGEGISSFSVSLHFRGNFDSQSPPTRCETLKCSLY
jgi:hypothetical protein